jgi:hypothetical protein
MDDFELRLKSVPLARPSEEMKRRIFGTGPGRPRITEVFRRRIPLGWAALIALFTGLAGMYLSQWLSGPAPLPSEMVIVQIIEAPSEQNPFDFTEPAADFMPGELTGRIETPKEI